MLEPELLLVTTVLKYTLFASGRPCGRCRWMMGFEHGTALGMAGSFANYLWVCAHMPCVAYNAICGCRCNRVTATLDVMHTRLNAIAIVFQMMYRFRNNTNIGTYCSPLLGYDCTP